MEWEEENEKDLECYENNIIIGMVKRECEDNGNGEFAFYTVICNCYLELLALVILFWNRK